MNLLSGFSVELTSIYAGCDHISESKRCYCRSGGNVTRSHTFNDVKDAYPSPSSWILELYSCRWLNIPALCAIRHADVATVMTPKRPRNRFMNTPEHATDTELFK